MRFFSLPSIPTGRPADVLFVPFALAIFFFPVISCFQTSHVTSDSRSANSREEEAKLYLLRSTDRSNPGPSIRASSYSAPVALVSKSLEVRLPFSAGWNIRINRVMESTNPHDCGSLFRRSGESMWYHRDGRIIEKTTAHPLVCSGTLLPARVEPEQDTCGYVDGKTLQWKVQPRFFSCTSFSEGLAWAETSPTVYICLNELGVEAFPQRYARPSQFSEGLALVQPIGSSNFGYIDKTGKLVIPAQFTDADSFNEGLAPVIVETNLGVRFIDKSGKDALGISFERVLAPFSEGRAFVRIGGELKMIDTSGKTIPMSHYADRASKFSGGVAVVRIQSGQYRLTDRNGKDPGYVTFDTYPEFLHGFGRTVVNGDRSAIINKLGNIQLESNTARFSLYQHPFLQRFESGRTDLIDLNGKALLRVEGTNIITNPTQ